MYQEIDLFSTLVI